MRWWWGPISPRPTCTVGFVFYSASKSYFISVSQIQ